MTMFDYPELIILSGLPGSGKTKYRNEWLAAADQANRRYVNYDETRVKLFGPGWKFNLKDEDTMQSECRAYVKKSLEQGYDVMVDNTNLTVGARDRWRDLAATCNLPVTVVEHELDTPVDTCVLRDSLRKGNARVGRAIIERMALFNGYIDWADKSYFHNDGGKDFIVVDMDGTLADCEHRRPHVYSTCIECGAHAEKSAGGKPHCSNAMCGSNNVTKKDWPAFFRECDKDPVIQPIKELVITLSMIYQVLIVSGRPMDKCGKATEAWLKDNGIQYRHLFMRNNGDSRDDTIVKQEILDLLPKERIAYVLDDRDKVVEMWRKNGLTCLQVARGDF